MTNTDVTESPPPEGGAPPTELKRAIGPKLLLLFIIGDILGTGVYALTGNVAKQVGGALWVPFLLAFVSAFLTAFSYLELVGKFPRAAGAALYTHKAWGVHFFTFMVAFTVMSSGMSSASSAARAVGSSYIPKLFEFGDHFPDMYNADGTPGEGLIIPIAIAFLLIFAALNLRGVSESVKANVAFTIIEMTGLAIVVVIALIGIFEGKGDAGRLGEFNTADAPVFLAVIGATSLAFFAMVGFEDSVNMAEETTNPRIFPRAMLTGMCVAAGIYLTVAILSSTLLSPADLSKGEAGALQNVVSYAVPGFPLWIFLAISIFAVSNSALINMMMASRLVYGMSRQHVIPAVLGKVAPTRRTPWTAIIFTSLVAMALTSYSNTQTLGATTSLLLLAVFTVVNIAVLVLRRSPVEHKHFKTPTPLPVLGAVISLILIVPWTSIYNGAWQPAERDKFALAGYLLAIGLVLWLATFITQRLTGHRADRGDVPVDEEPHP